MLKRLASLPKVFSGVILQTKTAKFRNTSAANFYKIVFLLLK